MSSLPVLSPSLSPTFDASLRRDAGFTLVELLVAITLLGFIAVLIFGALRFGTRAWERSEAVIVQVDDIGVTQALLRRLVGEAYPMFIPDPARPRVDFAGAGDRLSLLAPLPDALESGGMARFTLFARERAGRGELDLAWQPELAREGDASGQPRQEPLVTGIARLEIAYFGSERPSEAASWHDRWSDQMALPALVRIRVEFPREDGRVWPELVVAPRLTVDQSCLYDPVTRHCRGR
jgi:general secretion pathway protein J